jgi:hypothetical protein
MDDRRDRSDQDADDASYAETLKIINEFIAERKGRTIAEGREEGRKQGADESLRQALIDMYAARIGTMPESLRAIIEATTDASALSHWVTLVSTATADEIAAALLAGKPGPRRPMDDREHREHHDPAWSYQGDNKEIKAMDEFYAQWVRRLREEGFAIGFQEGLQGRAEGGCRGVLARIYRARFGASPAAPWEAIEGMRDVSTLRRWVTLLATATAAEIATALLTDQPAPQSA